MRFTFTPILVIVAVLAPARLYAADVYVDGAAVGCATGAGTAADPVCTITAALALASPGDTIRIAPGTYTENLTIGFDLDLIGTGGAEVTIVDGSGVVLERVVTIPSAVAVGIDGLTITNGRTSTENGGGVRVDGALVLTNSTVTGNETTSYGGGLYGSPGSDILIDSCTIHGNTSRSSFGNMARGGGMFVLDGNLTVLGSTISENRAFAYLDGACGFPVGQGGGGIAFQSFQFHTDLTILNSTIAGNGASCDGGGISILTQYGSANIENTTISGNIANYGAGMLTTKSTLTNVTITGNIAAGSYYSYEYTEAGHWGGVAAYGPAASHVVHNSLITDNARQGSSIGILSPQDLRGDFTSLGHNVVGAPDGAVSGFVNGVIGDQVGTVLNPILGLLGPLADNGGPTQTHALRLGSPAIDQGDASMFLPFDQRGNPRPVGASPDVGAVEHDLSDVSYCNGDGGTPAGCTNCPCANNALPGTIGGCLNSSGTSARLEASGSTSVSLPPMVTNDLRFGLSGAPPLGLCVLVSGSNLAPANPANPCFDFMSGVQSSAFNGLRCAISNFRRHGARTSNSSGQVGVTNQPWGGEGGPGAGIAQAFGGFSSGQTRYFQTIYREVPSAVCLSGLNTSQAVEIVFSP